MRERRALSLRWIDEGTFRVHLSAISPEFQCLTLREVRQTHSIIDSHGFVDSSVRFSWPRMPSRTAAGMLEDERQFRRIIGYRDLAKLAVSIEREFARTTIPTPTKEVATLVTASPSHWGLCHEIPRQAGHPPSLGP